MSTAFDLVRLGFLWAFWLEAHSWMQESEALGSTVG